MSKQDVLPWVRRSGRPGRVDSFAGLSGPGPELARRVGVVASAAAPLVVEGSPWGALVLVSRAAPLAAGIEVRLAQFADLAAIAIANAQSRAELQLLADEQGALRRVAELVARGGNRETRHRDHAQARHRAHRHRTPPRAGCPGLPPRQPAIASAQPQPHRAPRTDEGCNACWRRAAIGRCADTKAQRTPRGHRACSCRASPPRELGRSAGKYGSRGPRRSSRPERS